MIEAAENIKGQFEEPVDKKRLKRLPLAPIDVFPAEIQALIGRAVETFGTTGEIVISALLAISGGAIGSRRLLKIKPQWTPHAALYVLISAPTGESKSPVINWLMEPVEALERQWLNEYHERVDYYETRMMDWKRGEKKPEKPTRHQIKVGDITSEALIDALNANPGGLIRYRDEGRAFFTDADKYTGASGSDQTKYLEAYDRRPIQIDRVRKERISYVYKPCISLLGSIQPKVLVNCFTDLDTASGYLGRFIIIHSSLKEPALWSETAMSASDVAVWHKLINFFVNLDMVEDENGGFDGRIIDVTPAAKNIYIEYYDKLTALPFVETDVFREIISKSKEHALRLCLILHCMEHAVSGADEMQPVTEATMQKAVKLAEWVYAHNERTWQMIVRRLEEPDRQPVERRIAQAIYDLREQIQNSTLTTAEITAQVNKGHAENFHLTAKTVGRICAGKLRLEKKSDTSERGYLVSPGVINRLKDEYTLTLNALNALNASNNEKKQALKAFEALSISKDREFKPMEGF